MTENIGITKDELIEKLINGYGFEKFQADSGELKYRKFLEEPGYGNEYYLLATIIRGMGNKLFLDVSRVKTTFSHIGQSRTDITTDLSIRQSVEENPDYIKFSKAQNENRKFIKWVNENAEMLMKM